MLWLIFAVLFVPLYLFLDWFIRSFKISDYENKFVVISGCDSGFGNALALRLDSMGFNVIAGCLTKDGEESLSTQGSKKLRTYHLDVSSTESIQRMNFFVGELLPENQGLWALVNNAGVAGQTGPPDLNTVHDYKRTLKVNLFGHMEMCRLFLPLIRLSKGRIISITSVAGRIAGAEGPYCASKFGLEGYTDLLRRELYCQGIKVSLLEPGFFKTNILNLDSSTKVVLERMQNASEEVKAAYGNNFAKFTKSFERRINSAVQLAEINLDPVINAYVHAITSKFPRTRYVIGTMAKYIFIPSTYLPDWILNIAVPRAMSGKFI